MTEETLRIVLVTCISTLPGFLGAITSFLAILRVNDVHRLVNSQLTGSLEREAAARMELSKIHPSEENIAKATASKQALDDHKM